MKTLIYILPTTRDHEGINIKVDGQYQALSNHFKVTVLQLTHNNQSNLFKKIFSTLTFQCKAIVMLCCYHYFFIRYNPKTNLLNTLLPLFSWFKNITIEHNLKMEKELDYLNRPIEKISHLLTLQWLKLGDIQHLCVNNELKDYLLFKKFKPHRVVYAQNGYQEPQRNHKNTASNIIEHVQNFQKQFSKTAIFVGSGRPWHGLSNVIDLIKTNPNIGLIIVGPYEKTTHNQCLYLGNLKSTRLIHIMELCDFGISTFNWHMLDITEGSPLKSRQYLCSGLPILVNYYDCAADFKELQPFIFNYNNNPDAFKMISKFTNSKQDLKSKASHLLNWKNVYQHIRFNFKESY